MNDDATVASPDEYHADSPFTVVGIGASAGGIRALKEFFAAVAPDSGLAYIVVLHLSPEHESSLASILTAETAIPVTQIRHRVHIEPNHIYVVSPNNVFAMADGHLDVLSMAGIEERRAPVDVFFRTLSETQGPRAVSVILSGTGANGSAGMKRVKERGGLCIAQEPAEADFAEMPRNAIATGLVDYVLPVAAIPARLAAFDRQASMGLVHDAAAGEQQEKVLVDIFALLRVRTGHDFSNYKRSTVLRRIDRRIHVHELDSIGEYARLLRDNRDEARALLRDLLISVTSFFRDSEAWSFLEREVVPKLFHNRGPSDQVRVWVLGCATGEEAYSIAMLLAEHARDPVGSPQLQIFATDIDSQALAKARAGCYTVSDTLDLSPERLRRFFVREGDRYRVRRELRELVLFAAHNVLKDPPFSHLDLITCRNLLIYLNRSAQDRILQQFHFGLNPGGFLFLGTSESAADAGNLYIPVSREHQIFESRRVETRPAPSPPAPTMPRFEEQPPDARIRERLSYLELHQRLLERYAAPSVIVSHDFEVLHLSDRVGRYLTWSGGEPTQNLLKLVRPELRLELHTALRHAIQHRTPAEAIAGPIQIDGTVERLKLMVYPVFSQHDASRGMILVLFEALEPTGQEPPARVLQADESAEPIARQLEEELVRLRLQLRNTVEQHELQQEELQASNEELHAMNEELRSSTEELETSKEELQSVNEELSTVNQELKIKVDELSHANNDTRNLMNSTDLATVFIDRSMRVRLFTPQARVLFNLIATDINRPLLDLANRLRYPELTADIDRVLETLVVAEREIQSADERWYIARVLPYRTAEDRIGGVVLTFIDITERKRAEQAARESEGRMRLVIDVVDYAIVTLDTEGRIVSWNNGARALFGYSADEAIGKHINLIFVPEDVASDVAVNELRTARDAGRATDERWHLAKDGRRVFVSGVMAPLLADHELIGYTKIVRDLTPFQRHEEEMRQAREQLEERVRERTDELSEANRELRRQFEQRAQAEQSRLELLHHVVQVQEDERRRISRELHDQLGQEMTALRLKLSALKSSDGLGPAVQRQIEALEAIVRQLDTDIEFLVWKLRPTGLDDNGLAETLSSYVDSWSKSFGISADLNMSVSERLPLETETVLYRIAQEALTNVAKHARASRVELRLERDGDFYQLTIEDDGIGFDASEPHGHRSLGLLSMRERAVLVNGKANIESRRGAGTTVRVRVPA